MSIATLLINMRRSSSKEVQELRQKLIEQLSTMSELHLSKEGFTKDAYRSTDITAEDIANLFDCLKSCPSLSYVNFYGILLNREAALPALSQALEHNNTLTKINLSDNTLHNRAGVLANGFKVNTTLKELDLSQNYIGDEAMTAIIHTLLENKTLEVINLTGNYISKDNSFLLWKLVSSRPKFFKLEIDAGCMTPEALTYLTGLIAAFGAPLMTPERFIIHHPDKSKHFLLPELQKAFEDNYEFMLKRTLLKIPPTPITFTQANETVSPSSTSTASTSDPEVASSNASSCVLL